MRLKVVEEGHEPPVKQMLEMIGLQRQAAMRSDRAAAPDVIRTLMYRPELWGRPYSDVMEDAMRGESDWSLGERELFAAWVSKLNQCPF